MVTTPFLRSCVLLGLAAIAFAARASAAPPEDSKPTPASAADESPAPPRAVGVITGSEINLRTGPSVDFHDVGQLRRGELVVLVPPVATGEGAATDGDDAEFRRVLVPGGPVVYVFASLVEWKDGELEGTVRADRVLMRATPSKAHYPVHDQRLGSGDTVIVLERVKGATKADGQPGGDWLKVVAPEHIHLWVHGDFVQESGDEKTRRGELVAISERRLDALTGGRAADRRAAVVKAEIAAFETKLVTLEQKVATDRAVEDDAKTAAALAADAPNDALRERALDIERDVRKSLHARRVAELERRAAEANRRSEELENELDQREREYERRMKELERRRVSGRGRPAAEGTVEMRKTNSVLVLADGSVLALRSLRFQLRDYAGKRVRVWGDRSDKDGTSEVAVTSIEIVKSE